MRRELAWVVVVASLIGAGCSDGVPAVAAPSGDQRVFSGIGLRVVTYETESPSVDGIEEPPGGRPIVRSLGVHVWVNGGRAEGRVPGFAVFVDGTSAREVGSAGFPQQWTYQFHHKSVPEGRSVVVELRHRESSFAFRTEPIAGQITAPRPDEMLPVDQQVVVRWTGQATMPPSQLAVRRWESGRGGSCRVIYQRVSTAPGEATFTPGPNMVPDVHDPPCVGEVEVEWRGSELTLASPFEALVLERHLRRFRRFQIR